MLLLINMEGLSMFYSCAHFMIIPSEKYGIELKCKESICFCVKLSRIEGPSVPRSVRPGHYIHRGSRGGSPFELCAFVLKFASNYHD